MNFSKLESFIIAGMVISTLAFHDKTALMVVFQLLGFVFEAFFLEFLCKKGNMRTSRELEKFLIWESCFLLLCFSSYIWAENRQTLLNCAISVCQVTMCGISIILFCDRKEKIDMVIKFILMASAVLIVRLLIVVPPSAWGDGTRVGQYLGTEKSGGYGNTSLTYVLSIGALFAFFKGQETKKRKYYLLFIAYTVFSMLSGSKKAMILFILTVLIAALLNSKNVVKLIVALTAAVIVSIIVWKLMMSIEVLYNTVGFRMEFLLNFFSGGETDASTESRMYFLNQAFERFKEKPILGWGLDGFRYTNYKRCWAENNLLELMADLGFIGTIIYYSLPVSVISKSIKGRMKKLNGSALVITLMSCLIFIDMSMVTYSSDYMQLYIVLALLIVSDKYSNKYI